MRANNLREFFPERYPLRLESAKGIPEVFELVKDAVQEREGVLRTGLALGLTEMEGSDDKVLCGLHPLGTNIILINKLAIKRVQAARPELHKPFLFHVLLHEYLNTIGLAGEGDARAKVLEITLPLFGEEHPATLMAKDMSRVFPFIAYPMLMALPEGTKVELL